MSGFLPQFLADVTAPDMFPIYVAGSLYLVMLFAGMLVDIVLAGRLLAFPPAWDSMAARIKSRPWTMRDALWVFVILMLIQICASLVYWTAVKFKWLAGNESETSLALVQGLLFHGVALLIIMVLIRRKISSWSKAFGINWPGLKKSLGQALASYVGIAPIVFVTSILFQVFLYAAGYPVTLQDVVAIFLEPQPLWSLLLLLILAVVVAPLIEEALFRGILLPALMKKMGTGTAIVISSAFFALIHQHIPSAVPLFILAVVLSLLYIYSGSLWTAVVLHAIFNAGSICLLLLTCSA